jgi:uncharacterized protein YndB with AHSA1/START domain
MTNIDNVDTPAIMLAINVDQLLPYSPARVWQALTSPELLARWFMPNDFRLEVGHTFTFQSVPIPSVKFGGTIYCEVLDFEIERRLRISWIDRGENGLTSTVIWRLEPEGAGTRLYMTHEGFDPNNPLQQQGHSMMSNGWRSNPRHLAELLAGEES